MLSARVPWTKFASTLSFVCPVLGRWKILREGLYFKAALRFRVIVPRSSPGLDFFIRFGLEASGSSSRKGPVAPSRPPPPLAPLDPNALHHCISTSHAYSIPLQDSLQPCKLTPLGETVIKEFRGTALMVQRDPWNLMVAASYLTKLCDDSEACRLPEPPALSFIFDYVMPSLGAAGQLVSDLILDGTQGVVVREIAVVAKAKTPSATPKAKSSAQPKLAPMKRPAGAVFRKPAAKRPAGAQPAAAPAPVDGAVAPEEAAAPGPVPAPEGPEAVAPEDAAAPGPAHAPEGPEAPGIPGVPNPFPLELPAGFRYGCSKCAYKLKKGCKQCRDWAARGHRNFFKTHDDRIVQKLSE